MKRRMGPAVLLALLSAGASAAAGEVTIDDPWARATLGPVLNSAAYMTIRSDAADRLTGASSPLARSVELHTTMDHAGVSTMRPVAAIEIGPDRPAVLQPGDLHLMIIGLSERLEEGRTFPLQLTFEQAGAVTVEVPVRSMAGGHGGGHGAAQPPRDG